MALEVVCQSAVDDGIYKLHQTYTVQFWHSTNTLFHPVIIRKIINQGQHYPSVMKWEYQHDKQLKKKKSKLWSRNTDRSQWVSIVVKRYRGRRASSLLRMVILTSGTKFARPRPHIILQLNNQCTIKQAKIHNFPTPTNKQTMKWSTRDITPPNTCP